MAVYTQLSDADLAALLDQKFNVFFIDFFHTRSGDGHALRLQRVAGVSAHKSDYVLALVEHCGNV